MTKAVGPYTPVVRAGDWIIVSGQLGMKDGALVAGGVAAQTAQAVVNLKMQLQTVGATLKDVSKTLCFLTDMDTFATFNEAYVEGFGGSRPARSTIGVAALPFGGVVEIEAWAYKPETRVAKGDAPTAVRTQSTSTSKTTSASKSKSKSAKKSAPAKKSVAAKKTKPVKKARKGR